MKGGGVFLPSSPPLSLSLLMFWHIHLSYPLNPSSSVSSPPVIVLFSMGTSVAGLKHMLICKFDLISLFTSVWLRGLFPFCFVCLRSGFANSNSCSGLKNRNFNNQCHKLHLKWSELADNLVFVYKKKNNKKNKSTVNRNWTLKFLNSHVSIYQKLSVGCDGFALLKMIKLIKFYAHTSFSPCFR